MATTVTPATLTVTLTESITLNGVDHGGTNSFTFSSINEVYKRIVTIPASNDTTIAEFQTSAHTSNNAIDLEDVRYIRVTNLDDTNPVTLSLQVAGGEGGTANMSTSVLLEAGKNFVLGTVHDGIALDDDAASIVASLNDLESILVDSGSNAVDLEIFVASV